jgi:hypothetical protein
MNSEWSELEDMTLASRLDGNGKETGARATAAADTTIHPTISEESILRDSRQGGILVTDEVDVTYK